MRAFAICLCLMLVQLSLAQAANKMDPSKYSGESESDKVREEDKISLPPFPTASGLREIYVSAVASNVYSVDADTLSVGADRVIRYVLVVQASGGARNVSFEGIDCLDRTWKLYATGRSDGTWSLARRSEWREIENKPVNRHHAALSRDYFCPNGGVIMDADEGRRALRLGKHPNAS